MAAVKKVYLPANEVLFLYTGWLDWQREAANRLRAPTLFIGKWYFDNIRVATLTQDKSPQLKTPYHLHRCHQRWCTRVLRVVTFHKSRFLPVFWEARGHKKMRGSGKNWKWDLTPNVAWQAKTRWVKAAIIFSSRTNCVILISSAGLTEHRFVSLMRKSVWNHFNSFSLTV